MLQSEGGLVLRANLNLSAFVALLLRVKNGAICRMEKDSAKRYIRYMQESDEDKNQEHTAKMGGSSYYLCHVNNTTQHIFTRFRAKKKLVVCENQMCHELLHPSLRHFNRVTLGINKKTR